VHLYRRSCMTLPNLHSPQRRPSPPSSLLDVDRPHLPFPLRLLSPATLPFPFLFSLPQISASNHKLMAAELNLPLVSLNLAGRSSNQPPQPRLVSVVDRFSKVYATTGEEHDEGSIWAGQIWCTKVEKKMGQIQIRRYVHQNTNWYPPPS
jgi:hypothetical protein